MFPCLDTVRRALLLWGRLDRNLDRAGWALATYKVLCKRAKILKYDLLNPFTRQIRGILERKIDYSDLDSFVIYVCVEGRAEIRAGEEKVPVQKGEVVLLPATTEEIVLAPGPDTVILEVTIS